MDQETVWDSIAKGWREFRSNTPKEVLDFLEGKQGMLLDLGCGTGRNFVSKKGLELYGVDFSSQMLFFADQRASDLGFNVTLKKAPAWNTGFDTNYFNYIICHSVLHCIDSKKKRDNTLKEIFRVLKSGCQALITVWSKNSSRVKNKGKECFVPWSVNAKKEERYTYIYDKEEFKSDLEKTGFTILSIEESQNIVVIVKKE